MAKRYDNDFDAEGFVENFRAHDDSTTSQSPSANARTDRLDKPVKGQPTESADEYRTRYVDDLKYRYPPNRWPQVMIAPEFTSKINGIENLCGNRRANLSTYINNVLEQHFRDCEAQIKELKKKYNDYE